jgi:O-antigen ligase
VAASRRALPERDRKQPRESISDRIVWWLVLATTLFLPLIVQTAGKDAFRLPRELALIAAAVILAAVIVCTAILGHASGRNVRWDRWTAVIAAAALMWSATTAIVSANIALSVSALLYAAAALVLFVASYQAMQNRSAMALALVLLPAVVNAIVAVLQRLDLWTPFGTATPLAPHVRGIALLGNTNDVGMYLFGPALVAATLAAATRKWIFAAAAALLLAGIAASETVGAMAAVSAALFVLLYRLRPKVAVVAAIVVVLFGATVIGLSPRRRGAAQVRLSEAAHGNFDRLLSGRMLPFYAATRMFVRHPVFGVGIGAFRYEFFDEKIATEIAHPELMGRHIENYGEVHNEFLQIASETGLPGLALFLFALFHLGRVSFRPAPNGRLENKIAQTMALPLAVGIAVLSLSAFPLRIAAATGNLAFIVATVVAWGVHARD